MSQLQVSSLYNIQEVKIDLWDCSGDKEKYESCWPAYAEGCQGILFVVDGRDQEQLNELDGWYDSFVEMTGVSSKQCMVFNHNTQQRFGGSSRGGGALGHRFSKINTANTSLEDDQGYIFDQFDGLVAHVAQVLAESEEKGMMY
eukprot:TRINITY_DN868_c0_g1_i7.p1 TRINITY_DN868_c0_g1~~TRINITY_DN868_c0_g1_i7.p1  ORF type:complete len:167 (-),score=27.55 TRINITY_DN868_c0_g1_i7:37-468(-)